MRNDINVVFLGGSITWGAGADTREESWAYQVQNHLSAVFTGRSLQFYNLGISGTGSRLGAFRLEEQVLPCLPDILFFEFSVNDSKEAKANEVTILENTEYIVRTLIKSNPNIKIIFLYSAMKSFEACAGTHQKIADFYHIPSLNLQQKVKTALENHEFSWEECFVDEVHPSTRGHRFYADEIISFLTKNWFSCFASEPILPAEPLVPLRYFHPCIISSTDYSWSEEWQQQDYQDNKRCPVANVNLAAFSKTVGSSFQIEFYGSSFGLYHYVAGDCGTLVIEIDDLPAEILDCYYNCGGDFVSFYNKYHLPFGKHHATLTIREQKNPNSTGHLVGIAGFLIG